MKLLVLGNVPSKKNGKRIIYNKRAGRTMIISSDKYLEWERVAVVVMAAQAAHQTLPPYPLHVTCTLFYDNRRRHDLDNSAASVLDALTASGVIDDDNVNCIDRLNVIYGGYDKTNPRVEILLE